MRPTAQLLCPGLIVPIFPGHLFMVKYFTDPYGIIRPKLKIVRETMVFCLKQYHDLHWDLNTQHNFPPYFSTTSNFFLIQSPKTHQLALAQCISDLGKIGAMYNLYRSDGYDVDRNQLQIGTYICNLKII